MFSLSDSSNNIKAKLAVAAVVVAGALAMPAMSSAAATGCAAGGTGTAGPECNFVGGTGANATTPTGGSTQFRVNPSGATVACTDSRARARTDGSNVINVRLTFANCTAAGFPATVTCATIDPASSGTLGPLSTPISITSITSPGIASGTLQLGPGDCSITVSGLGLTCTIVTARAGNTHNIAVNATNATVAMQAQLTVAVTGNTNALSFSSSGSLCSLASVPATGTATFSNTPIGAPSDIVYTGVASEQRLDVR